MDVSIQLWYMIEIMKRDFSGHHQLQVPITKNKLGMMGMMSKIPEQVGMDYPEVLGPRYVAHSVNDFIFLWEEKGSVEN